MRVSIRRALLASGWLATITTSLNLWSAPQTTPSADLGLTVPAGFDVERVAGPPLVDRPIVADFDDEGRLYVADSSGSNDKVDKQLADKPHRIVRLEDTNGDGRFDKRVVFADRMMFPEGTMWFDGSLYVAAPPSIWKLTDTDGDGVADNREEWFQGKTLTGCANDLHGPYLGPDGWIYWTKGAFAQQTYERAGKAPLVTRASHIFRRRPGEAAIEPVMTGGMDNPVDVAFTSAGERLFTATFLEHPQAGRRDAIVHAIYGGVYGKPHAVIDGHKRTGDLMPVLAQLGPAVPSGFTRYASRVFGESYRDNLFATMFNLQKVTRHVLEPSGSTFTLRTSDFLVSNSRDFHPTDVLEDADGSLLVIDTGPWYKLCCPTSQLAKPDIPGAIYRVRRRGAPKVQDARGQRFSWPSMDADALARLLDDRRPAVQNRALYHFGKAGSRAVGALDRVLKTSKSVDARRNAVWALTRIEGDAAREAVRFALNDTDPGVRQAALHSASVWRDRAAVPRFIEALESSQAPLQRAAAEALGRAGDPRAVPALIEIAARPLDRVLEHSVTFALIEIADPSSVLTSAQHASSSRSKRAALIALDQMDGGGLGPDAVMPLFDSPDSVLKQTAWWIAGNHPEWGGALADFFQARLNAAAATASDRTEMLERLALFAASPAIQDLLAANVAQPSSPSGRLTALSAMAGASGRLKQLPASWIGPLARLLGDRDESVVRQALAVVRRAPAPKEGMADLQAALLRVARDRMRSIEIRVDALSAAQTGAVKIGPDEFDVLQAGLDPSQPALARVTAARILEAAALERAELLSLAERVRLAGPLELPHLLRAFEKRSDEAVGKALIAALRDSKSRSTLRPDQVRTLTAGYPPSVQSDVEALLASVRADSMQQVQRLEQLLGGLGEGDIRRGQQVFNSQKAACYSCHAIGYLGGRIGPDLTRIGQVRSERDLLEAIVFPSASFARSYEPFTVRTASGIVHNGVLRSDSSEEIVLGTATGDELRIPRGEIADMQPGTVSLMPAGLDEQLTRQELADLLAFLKATRSGAN